MDGKEMEGGKGISNVAHWSFASGKVQPWLVWLSGLVVLPKVNGCGFLSGQPTSLLCGLVRLGAYRQATDRYFSRISRFLSLSFSLPSPLSKNKEIKPFLKGYQSSEISEVKEREENQVQDYLFCPALAKSIGN